MDSSNLVLRLNSQEAPKLIPLFWCLIQGQDLKIKALDTIWGLMG